MINKTREAIIIHRLVIFTLLACVFCGFEVHAAPFLCPDEEAIRIPKGWNEALKDAMQRRKNHKVLVLLEEVEHTGAPGVLLYLGRYYHGGLGEFPSEEARGRKVLSLYTKAAYCGDPHAIIELAGLYTLGHEGVPVDVDRAECLKHERLSDSLDITNCGILVPDVDD